MGKFDDYKFHCSSLGAIMTASRDKKDPLGETCKEHLLECWIAETYGRHEDITNKYMEKGTLAEESNITLYSRVKRKFYRKNLERFENDYIVGTPDIVEADNVTDVKTSWSIFTFFSVFAKSINKTYKYQLNGYRELLKVPKATLVYTLVNTPEELVEQEKSRLRYKLGLIDYDASEIYQAACVEIDRNHNFDDIPINDRYIEVDVLPVDIADMYEKIRACRVFMNELSEHRVIIDKQSKKETV